MISSTTQTVFKFPQLSWKIFWLVCLNGPNKFNTSHLDVIHRMSLSLTHGLSLSSQAIVCWRNSCGGPLEPHPNLHFLNLSVFLCYHFTCSSLSCIFWNPRIGLIHFRFNSQAILAHRWYCLLLVHHIRWQVMYGSPTFSGLREVPR